MISLRTRLAEMPPDLRRETLGSLAGYLVEARQAEQMCRLLTSFNFIEAKISLSSPQALIDDYELASNSDLLVANEVMTDLNLLRDTLRLTAHILIEDSSQLPGQLLGRLMSFKGSVIQKLLEQIHRWHSTSWLRPLTPSLMQPSGFLQNTFEDYLAPFVITPDGQSVISASLDGFLKLWNLNTGEVIRSLNDSGLVQWLVLLPNGSQLLTATDDGVLKVWNLKDGVITHTLSTPSNRLAGLGITPDGQQAILVSCSGTVAIWDLESKTNSLNLDNVAPAIEKAIITPDGKHVICIESGVAWATDKIVRVRNLENGQELYSFLDEPSPIVEIAVAPNGQFAVSASWHPQHQVTIKMWDLTSGKEHYKSNLDDVAISALALTPDAHFLLTSTDLGSLKIWNIEIPSKSSTVSHAHDLPITTLSVTPDGKRLLSASPDRILRVWNLEIESKALWQAAHRDRVTAIAITPDSKRIISAARDNTVKVWNLDDGAELYTLESQPVFVSKLAVIPGSQTAIAVAYNLLSVWNIGTREVIHMFHHPDSITAAVSTLDGKHIITAAKDHMLRMWNLENGLQVHALHDQAESVVDVLAVTPDGSRIISASSSVQQVDNTLKVWNTKDGTLLEILEDHTSPIQALVVTTNSQILIFASLQDIKVWNLRSKVELFTLKGHTAPITAVAITPDERKALSASSDATLKMWDLKSGSLLYELSDHPRPIMRVAITSDGKRGVSHSFSSLKVWNLEERTCMASFNTDSAITTYAIAPDGMTIVVGEKSGQLHILYLEGVE
jgi:WD40 repeat protein